MKGLKASQVTFTFWILLTLFFVLYVVLISFNNMIFSKLIYLFIFFMIILGFLGAIIAIYIRYIKVRYLLKIKKEKEKNIRDFYRYQKFLDPPEFDVNN